MKYRGILNSWILACLVSFIIGCGGGSGQQTNDSLPSEPVSESLLIRETGDLESYLKAISYGVEGDNHFKQPLNDNIQIFENAIQLILAKNYLQAAVLTQSVGYELVHYLDIQSAKNYYLLREKHPIPSSDSHGGGYYLFKPDATYNVAIHVPHPKADKHTDIEGIELFLQADVKYLLLAGSHRRSSDIASHCQNTNDYRISDGVHNRNHYFFSAHKVIEDFNNESITLEMHGFGSSFLEILQTQCSASENEFLVNLSETRSDLNPDTPSLMHALASIIANGNVIQSCIYSKVLDSGSNDIYTRSLGGTLNTLGRYTNLSPDVCNSPAKDELNTHRYLHIEQSFAVRSQKRQLMIDYIKQAIKAHFNSD